MPPIYLIIGIVVVGVLFWQTLRANKKRAKVRSLANATAELIQENRRLRHVLAEMSLDNHALKYRQPERW